MAAQGLGYLPAELVIETTASQVDRIFWVTRQVGTVPI